MSNESNIIETLWQKNNIKKPRQEICALLKWFCFFLSFCIFLAGVTFSTLGIYLFVKEPRPITEWIDLIFNAAIFIIIIGLSICIISLCGLFGSLRDNVLLLKAFALFIFISYILLIILTFILFMLFYSKNSDGISAYSIFIYLIKKYHTNRNIADFVDYIQDQLQCCGATSTGQGFRDWQFSEIYKCNSTNPYPESCSVPFSCCRKTIINEAAKLSSSSSSSSSLHTADSLNSIMRTFKCWKNVLKTDQNNDFENNIYLNGCLQPMHLLFEKYAIQLGIFIAIIIFPMFFSICLTQCLARQIDYQKYLLQREERQNERRKRRERRYLEQQNKKILTTTPTKNSSKLNDDEQFNATLVVPNKILIENKQKKKLSPPNFPPPPTPRNDQDAAKIAAANIANKKQLIIDEKMRQKHHKKGISTSPLRQKTKNENNNDCFNLTKNNIYNNRQFSTTALPIYTQNLTNNNNNSNLTILPSAPPLPPYTMTQRQQQYILKQSDFT